MIIQERSQREQKNLTGTIVVLHLYGAEVLYN